MFTILIRSVLLYLFMLLTLRAMGKRQQGQFQPYEFAVALLMADLIAVPMGDIATPLLNGILPVAALFILHSAISLIALKSDVFRAFISGKPVVVVNNGVIDRHELQRLCLSLSDLLEGMRENGILNPASVGTAIIEADGGVSVFEHEKGRPVTVNDLNLEVPRSGLPLALILDGKIQKNNLEMTRRGSEWLEGVLKKYGLSPKRVLLASLDTMGALYVQDADDAILTLQALKPEEVCW